MIQWTQADVDEALEAYALNSNAQFECVNRRFRLLSKQSHPDMNTTRDTTIEQQLIARYRDILLWWIENKQQQQQQSFAQSDDEPFKPKREREPQSYSHCPSPQSKPQQQQQQQSQESSTDQHQHSQTSPNKTEQNSQAGSPSQNNAQNQGDGTQCAKTFIVDQMWHDKIYDGFVPPYVKTQPNVGKPRVLKYNNSSVLSTTFMTIKLVDITEEIYYSLPKVLQLSYHQCREKKPKYMQPQQQPPQSTKRKRTTNESEYDFETSSPSHNSSEDDDQERNKMPRTDDAESSTQTSNTKNQTSNSSPDLFDLLHQLKLQIDLCPENQREYLKSMIVKHINNH